ncbi:hypothetical protein HGRIS_008476 [Hohenbuehelia grisea]|uniref:Proteophosphoglycan ppg4 n=1 Tax=Hohenbuehelia grisea TaxID=104357 RepID=A0ABR3J840_9AGAR
MLTVRSHYHSYSPAYRHAPQQRQRPRGRSQQVSRAALARLASEERRERQEERNSRGATVRVDSDENNRLRGNHDSAPVHHNDPSISPPHPPPQPLLIVTDNLEPQIESEPQVSLTDQLHDAYAADNFVLARMLVLRLDGVHVTDPADPRIDLVTDADFDRHFMPNGPLQIDGPVPTHSPSPHPTDIRSTLVAKEGWVLEKAKLWDESSRHMREERQRWKEQRRLSDHDSTLQTARASRVSPSRRPAFDLPPRRAVVSYEPLLREEPPRNEQNESQMSRSSSSSRVSRRAPSVVPFKEVLARMRGPLFPADPSDVVAHKPELTSASWTSQRLQASRDVKRFQVECMSSLQSPPELSVAKTRAAARNAFRRRNWFHPPREPREGFLVTTCNTCQLRCIVSPSTVASSSTPSPPAPSRPLSWLSFRNSLASPSSDSSTASSSSGSSTLSSTNSSLITTPATSPSNTPLSLSPPKPPLSLASPDFVLDVTPPPLPPQTPSQPPPLSPSQSRLLALSEADKSRLRARPPTLPAFSSFASWLRPSPKVQTNTPPRLPLPASPLSSPVADPPSPSDAPPGGTCRCLTHQLRVRVPPSQCPLTGTNSASLSGNSAESPRESVDGGKGALGRQGGEDAGPSTLAAIGRVFQRFRQFHEAYMGAMTMEFGDGVDHFGAGGSLSTETSKSADRGAESRRRTTVTKAAGKRRGDADASEPHSRAFGTAARLDSAPPPVRRGRSRSRRWRGMHDFEVHQRGCDTWDVYSYSYNYDTGLDRRRRSIRPRGFRVSKDDVKSVFGARLSPSPPHMTRASPSPVRSSPSASASSRSRSRSRSRESVGEDGEAEHVPTDDTRPSSVVVYIPLAPRYPAPPLPPHIASRRAFSPYAHAHEATPSPSPSRGSSGSRERTRVPYDPYACVFGCECQDSDDLSTSSYGPGLDDDLDTPTPWGRPAPTYVRPVANPVFLRLKAAQNCVQRRPPRPASPPPSGPRWNSDLSALDDSDSEDEDGDEAARVQEEGAKKEKEEEAQGLSETCVFSYQEQERALAALLGAGRAGAMGSGRERVCGVGGGARVRSLLAVGAVSVHAISVR